jgi:hypothetical protein
MATGATAPLNPILSRQMRSGRSPTAGARLPVAQAGQPSGAEINLSGEHPAASSAAIARSEESLPDPRAGVPVRIGGRFARLQVSPPINEEEPAVVEAPEAGRFGSVVSHETTQAARNARINISAVKALTPLVASISFYPGNAAEPTMKSTALANLIIKVQKAASDIVLAMEPTISNADWARGQVMQSLAAIAAKQWEARGKVDLDGAVQHMLNVLRNPSVELQSALDSFTGAEAYVEARTPDIAKARVSLSVTGAAWELYDWVTRDSLRIKDQPSRVFSYERPVDSVIETLMGRIIDEARGMQIQVNSADLQVSHLQGSIRRLVQLAGAEYVTQTNAILSWIDAPDVDPEERDRRMRAAVEQFDSHVVPRIMEYVHINFIGIEHRARRLMDEFDSGVTRPSPAAPQENSRS